MRRLVDLTLVTAVLAAFAASLRARARGQADSTPRSAVYGGARLGSYPAVVATVAGAIAAGLVIWAILSGDF